MPLCLLHAAACTGFRAYCMLHAAACPILSCSLHAACSVPSCSMPSCSLHSVSYEHLGGSIAGFDTQCPHAHCIAFPLNIWEVASQDLTPCNYDTTTSCNVSVYDTTTSCDISVYDTTISCNVPTCEVKACAPCLRSNSH